MISSKRKKGISWLTIDRRFVAVRYFAFPMVLALVVLICYLVCLPHRVSSDGRLSPIPRATPSAEDYSRLEQMRLPWDNQEFRQMGLTDDWVDHWNRKPKGSVGLAWDFARDSDDQVILGGLVLSPSEGYVSLPSNIYGPYGTYIDLHTWGGWTVRLAHIIRGSSVAGRYNRSWIPRGVPLGEIGQTGVMRHPISQALMYSDTAYSPHIHMELLWYGYEPPPIDFCIQRGIQWVEGRLPRQTRPFGVEQETLWNPTSQRKIIKGNQTIYQPRIVVRYASPVWVWDRKKQDFLMKTLLSITTEQWSDLHEYRVKVLLGESKREILDTGWVSLGTGSVACRDFNLEPSALASSFQRLDGKRLEWVAQVRFPDIREGHQGSYFYSDELRDNAQVLALDLDNFFDRARWFFIRRLYVFAAEKLPTRLSLPEFPLEAEETEVPPDLEPFKEFKEATESSICANALYAVKQLVNGLNSWDRQSTFDAIVPRNQPMAGIAWQSLEILQNALRFSFTLDDVEYECVKDSDESILVRIIGTLVLYDASSGEIIGWYDDYYVDVPIVCEERCYVSIDLRRILGALGKTHISIEGP